MSKHRRDAIVRIRLRSTASGGRRSPLRRPYFGCPTFFGDEETGWDCRFLTGEIDEEVVPGGPAVELPAAWLSRDQVRPRLHARATFRLWEARVIGEGEVLIVLAE